MWPKFAILGAALLCMACGNSDIGAEAKLKNRSSSSASGVNTLSNSYAAQAALSQTVCKAATVYESGDTFFRQVMTGLNLCYAPAAPAMVQVKVSAYSFGYRYCVVPVRGAVAGKESCFSMGAFTTSVNLQS